MVRSAAIRTQPRPLSAMTRAKLAAVSCAPPIAKNGKAMTWLIPPRSAAYDARSRDKRRKPARKPAFARTSALARSTARACSIGAGVTAPALRRNAAYAAGDSFSNALCISRRTPRGSGERR